jgi:hypothetical protein
MKVLRLFVPLAVLLLALFAERSRVQNDAAVVCRGTGLGLECTVTNQKSEGTLNVFWDARLQCRNGTVIHASASQRVPRDAQFVHLIPLADLKGLDRCDAGQSLVVENVVARNSR